jgi:cyclomaltodextrinase / maltogenic alpha-amylase / neopullulanase
MDDFIFGPLPPVEERLRKNLASRSGLNHQQARTPFHPQPGQPVTLELTAGPDHFIDRAWVYWSTNGADPGGQAGIADSGQVAAMECSAIEWDTSLWGYVRKFQAQLPGQPAGSVVRYRIAAAGPAQVETLVDGGAFYSYYVDDDPPPAWTQSAVVYQIFVDRFNPGAGRVWQKPDDLSGFFGGTLRGIMEKLDYLSALGVTVLWLSPTFPSPSHHGYDISDYLGVEPRLGTKEDLRELLDAAHHRGMRILLDLVPNHCSSTNPIFQQALADPASPYRDWFIFSHWPDEYACFFGNRLMPKINLRNPAARQYMLDAAVYWLMFGVDGFRVDHAVGPVSDFWADFRRATRAANPDSWTFGEVTDPPDIQLGFSGGLDGCLDFLLAESLRKTFLFGKGDAIELANFLERHDAYFPATFSRPSFIDNHDMNRVLWAAEGDQRRVRLAAMCQFSLPGQPVLYHGTEVGLSQEHDVHETGHGLEESRLPHPWGEAQDTDLLAYFQSLLALRRSETAMRSTQRRTLYADEAVLAYELRPSSDQGQTGLAVALNLATEARSIALAGNWSSLALATSVDCSVVYRRGATKVHLGPLSGVILGETA